MQRSKTIELIGIYLIIGFFSGLILSLFTYALELDALNERFTFQSILEIHKKHPLFYLVATLPLITLFIAYLLAKTRSNLLRRIEIIKEEEKNHLDATKKIINELSLGNLNAKIDHASFDDELAKSLQEMQNRLKENRETTRKNRLTDQQRNWTSTGLAEVGDLLRSHSSDYEQLGYAVISYLVSYLDINQGGFFLLEDSDEGKVLNMIACHAYERKKFPNHKVSWGEGLIGAVALEKKLYHTNKIPDSYLTVTSGLGRANPTNLLIVPLILNEEVYGVIELASFTQVESYKVQFIERVAEISATTLSIMHSNARTAQLLVETQEQASRLASQEEQVSKNVEDLKKMQIEAAKQSEQFISFTNTVNHTLIRAEYSDEGELINANTRFLKAFGYSGNREVEGKHVSSFIHQDDLEWFTPIWTRLSKGGQHHEGYMRHMQKLGIERWTMATYTCVRREDGSVEKVLFLAIDSSEQKEQELLLGGQIAALDELSIKAEFGAEGRFLSCNELFLKFLNYSSKELRDKNIFDFFPKSEQERFQEIWEQVMSGKSFQGQLRMMGRYEDDSWVRAAITSAEDIYGELEKIYLLAYDISKEKELEISLIDQNDKLQSTEEEVRLNSLDLQKQIELLSKKGEREKQNVELEQKKTEDIIERHPEPIVCINNLRYITLVNKSAEKYFSKSKKALINTKISSLLSASQQDEQIQALVDEGKFVKEFSQKNIEITRSEGEIQTRNMSLIKTESGAEIIYTLLLH